MSEAKSFEKKIKKGDILASGRVWGADYFGTDGRYAFILTKTEGGEYGTLQICDGEVRLRSTSGPNK